VAGDPAPAAIGSAGHVAAFHTQSDPTCDHPGLVIRQRPAAGTLVRTGSTVGRPGRHAHWAALPVVAGIVPLWTLRPT